jgi:hypothetical protein
MNVKDGVHAVNSVLTARQGPAVTAHPACRTAAWQAGALTLEIVGRRHAVSLLFR